MGTIRGKWLRHTFHIYILKLISLAYVDVKGQRRAFTPKSKFQTYFLGFWMKSHIPIRHLLVSLSFLCVSIWYMNHLIHLDVIKIYKFVKTVLCFWWNSIETTRVEQTKQQKNYNKFKVTMESIGRVATILVVHYNTFNVHKTIVYLNFNGLQFATYAGVLCI